MQIQEDTIKSIDMDITSYEDYLKEVQEIQLGSPIIDSFRSKTKWSVNASHLEEFVNKKLLQPEKVDGFRATYKNPLEHLCIFVFKPQHAGFIFRPFNIKFEG